MIFKLIKENKDFLYLMLLFFASSILFYKLPSSLNFIYFYSLFIIFFFSKNNHFWIVFFFLLLQPPGGLFLEGSGLPAISFGGKEIWYSDFFVFVSFVKSFKYKRKVKLFFKLPLIILGLYLIILSINTFSYGVSFIRFFRTIRFLLSWLLLVTFLRFFQNEEDYIKMLKLIFPLVFFLLIETIIEYITGLKSALFLGAEKVYSGFGGEMYGAFISDKFRIFNSPLIVFVALSGSLFYFFQKGKINKNYMAIVIVTCFIHAVLSATRGWIISFAFMIIFSSFVFGNLLYKRLFKFIPIVVVLLYVGISNQKISSKITYSLERFETLNLIIKEGDLSAGGTLKRLTERNDPVMKKVKEKLITGWGFSNTYWNTRDGHVGNQSMLLAGGIFGYLLWVYFWIYYIIKLYMMSVKRKNRNLLLFIISFLGMFLIHSSSAQIFQYTLNTTAAILIFFIFSFANTIYYQKERGK